MSELRVQTIITFSQAGDCFQEDHVLAHQEKKIFVVADGFGGPQPGAQASRASCEAVRNFLIKEAGDQDATMPFVLRSYFSLAGNVLFNALIHANRKILNLNRGKPIHDKGGASVLAGYMDGNLLALANVGLCNAWLMRMGKSRELVMPRSYSRLLDPFQDQVDESTRVPLMALGISEDLEPEICEYLIQPGDWLLLSTDGLSPVTRSELQAAQKNLTDRGQVRAEFLTEILKQNKSKDNTSLSLAIF